MRALQLFGRGKVTARALRSRRAQNTNKTLSLISARENLSKATADAQTDDRSEPEIYQEGESTGFIFPLHLPGR